MAGNPGAMGPPTPPVDASLRRSSRIMNQQKNTTLQAGRIQSQPSSSHSSSKRRYSDVEPSDFEPDPVVVQRTPTTAFSVATKRAIQRDGTNCWHCGAPDALEYIHIIGRAREKILVDLQSLGRTNVEFLHQKENGMCLCVLCHKGLDDHERPAWVFLPSNIDFFIEAEHANHDRRVEEFVTTGTYPKRTPPSVDAYIQTCGGFLTSWHGDPMLALHKAFKCVPGFRYLLPAALQHLDDLYEYNDLPPPSDAPSGHAQRRGDDDDNNPDADQDGANRSDVPLSLERANKGVGRGRGKGRGNNSAPRGTRGRGQVHQPQVTKHEFDHHDLREQATKRAKVEISPWQWGPHKTSNEQVDIFKKYRAHMRAAGYPLGSDVLISKRGRGAKNKSKIKRSPSPEDCEARDERVLGGVGPEGVREWLSNTS